MKNSVKEARAKSGITQAQLAEKVNVSRQTINSIETGRFVPSALLALKIASMLKTSIEILFILEESDWT